VNFHPLLHLLLPNFLLLLKRNLQKIGKNWKKLNHKLGRMQKMKQKVQQKKKRKMKKSKEKEIEEAR
jgi:hypothetical protein